MSPLLRTSPTRSTRCSTSPRWGLSWAACGPGKNLPDDGDEPDL